MKRAFKKSTPVMLVSIILILVAVVYSIINVPRFAISPNIGETLSNNVNVTINDDGSMVIHEKMRIKTTAREIYKDIYFNASRDFLNNQQPVFNKNGTATYVKVSDDNGNVIIEGDASKNYGSASSDKMLQFSWSNGVTSNWSKSESGLVTPKSFGDSVAIYLYKSNRFGPIVNIEYTYTILGAVVLFNDTAEINWKYASTNDMKTSNVDVKVNLPKTISTTISAADVYIFAHGSESGQVDYDENNPFEIILKSPELKVGEEIEARIMFPKSLMVEDAFVGNSYNNLYDRNHIDEAIEFEDNQRNQAENEYRFMIAINIISIILIAIIVISTIIVINKIYKYAKPHHTDFYGEHYRELPAEYGPAVMGYLYRFGEVDKNDVSATLLDLIRRKYIEIDAQGQSLTKAKVNYKMTLTDKPRDGLKPYEKKLIEWFFVVVGGGKELTLEQLDNFNKKEENALKYQKCNKEFNLQILNDSHKEKFFEDNTKVRSLSKRIMISYLILSLILLILSNNSSIPIIVSSIILGLGFVVTSLGYFIVKHTVKGNEDYVRWIAFKKFLEEFSNIKDYPMPGIVVWEHFMVYATAFGIADLVEKQLRFKYSQLSMEEQYAQSTYLRYPMFSHYYAYRIMSASRVGSQTIAKARAARANSSRGGGSGRGGFGGGSSFGGGGSGMRMR